MNKSLALAAILAAFAAAPVVAEEVKATDEAAVTAEGTTEAAPVEGEAAKKEAEAAK